MASRKKRQRVYLACRAIFSGPKSQIRKNKIVRKEIQDHEHALGSLSDMDVDEIVEIARGLLERQIFEFDLKARLEFPALFQSSRERDALREASELEAEQSVADLLEYVTDGEDNDDVWPAEAEPEEMPRPEEDTVAEVMEVVEEVFESTQRPALTTVPSLHPVRLPYKAQHVLLSEVQVLLEECFYDFARKWLPSLLEEKQCDCAIAIELTVWSHLLRRYAGKIPLEALDIRGDSQLDSTLKAVHKIRHSAVHRLRLTGSDVRDLVIQGAAAATMLRDLQRAAVLQELAAELGHKITSMELVKNDAEKTAVAQLQDIARRRAALDREEEAAIAEMLRRDADGTKSIGILVEESVGKILRAPRGYSEEEEDEEGDGSEEDGDEAYADAEESEDTFVEPTRAVNAGVEE
ncbi:hypothetical protein PFICI_10341 [Pestalotiopsis fici W106-1]|uniref:Uncharacterized protein n=1 Tax=Pestalotiopsis fici (strain W106-1 / CGMCC3.15140) TaxID=1229662 RepID=W3WWW8_PESFW|nr:uncharacterized protein PFICI_10341 [Pestalotiopsis fici W106-1]ETS78279.1 hypothetical protein PFICI_10341 [Pestalotiopsis fici W106-1]